MDCRVIWREDGAARLAPGNDDTRSRSRGAWVPELWLRRRTKIDSPPATRGRRSAERRMPTMCRASQTSARELAQLICCTAARHIGARPPSGASTAALAGTPIPAQLQAMLPGTRNQAGVTRSILSQFSCSTPRLGRSTEGNDARSRSAARRNPLSKKFIIFFKILSDVERLASIPGNIIGSIGGRTGGSADWNARRAPCRHQMSETERDASPSLTAFAWTDQDVPYNLNFCSSLRRGVLASSRSLS